MNNFIYNIPRHIINAMVSRPIKEAMTMLEQHVAAKIAAMEDKMVVRIGALQDSMAGKIAAVENDVKGKTAAVENNLAGRIAALEDSMAGKIAAVENDVKGKTAAVENNLAGRIAALEDSTTVKIAAAENDVKGKTAAVENNLAGRIAALEYSTAGKIAAVENSVSVQTAAVENNLAGRIAAMEESMQKRTAEHEWNSNSRTLEIGNALLALEMQSRILLSRRLYDCNYSQGKTEFTPVTADSFDVYLDKFRNLHPHLYDVWADANFGITVEEYKCRPEFSCAIDQRLDARLFKGFIAPYLSGRVLDVGCGPYALPNYLSMYPLDLISGIDPLEPFETHPFEFVRGFAEFLPWPDDTFDVVIAATSLDHTLDLELALSEVRRVLKPNGYLLAWDWFGENAEPYDPVHKDPKLVDRYHLFNFGEQWFENLVGKNFSIAEKFKLLGEYRYIMYYSLRLKAA